MEYTAENRAFFSSSSNEPRKMKYAAYTNSAAAAPFSFTS